MDAKMNFKILEEHNIEECAQLIGEIFVNFNSFAAELDYKPNELKEGVKKTLYEILPDKLTIVATDSNGKVIGCYAGIKFTKIQFLEKNNFKKRDNLIFNVDVEKMTLEQKNSVMGELEFLFLKEHYDKLKLKNECDQAVYGRYFCVSNDYFGTTLAKDLARNFFANLVDKNLQHCFGMVFNYKVFTLLSKYFKGEVVNQFKVTFDKITEQIDFDAFIFYGNSDSARQFLQPKF